MRQAWRAPPVSAPAARGRAGAPWGQPASSRVSRARSTRRSRRPRPAGRASCPRVSAGRARAAGAGRPGRTRCGPTPTCAGSGGGAGARTGRGRGRASPIRAPRSDSSASTAVCTTGSSSGASSRRRASSASRRAGTSSGSHRPAAGTARRRCGPDLGDVDPDVQQLGGRQAQQPGRPGPQPHAGGVGHAPALGRGHRPDQEQPALGPHDVGAAVGQHPVAELAVAAADDPGAGRARAARAAGRAPSSARLARLHDVRSVQVHTGPAAYDRLRRPERSDHMAQLDAFGIIAGYSPEPRLLPPARLSSPTAPRRSPTPKRGSPAACG